MACKGFGGFELIPRGSAKKSLTEKACFNGSGTQGLLGFSKGRLGPRAQIRILQGLDSSHVCMILKLKGDYRGPRECSF